MRSASLTSAVPKNDVRCEFLAGESPEALAATLIERLSAARIL